MKKPRFVYVLSAPAHSWPPAAYSSLEALVSDEHNTFKGTTSAIRAARKANEDSWPVVVKNHIIHKLEVKGRTAPSPAQ